MQKGPLLGPCPSRELFTRIDSAEEKLQEEREQEREQEAKRQAEEAARAVQEAERAGQEQNGLEEAPPEEVGSHLDAPPTVLPPAFGLATPKAHAMMATGQETPLLPQMGGQQTPPLNFG